MSKMGGLGFIGGILFTMAMGFFVLSNIANEVSSSITANASTIEQVSERVTNFADLVFTLVPILIIVAVAMSLLSLISGIGERSSSSSKSSTNEFDDIAKEIKKFLKRIKW